MEKLAQPLRVLLLADDAHAAGTLIDHIQAFDTHSRHRWHVANPVGRRYVEWLDFGRFDAIAIHYSVCVLFDHYVSSRLREKIARFPGPKIQFIQDEYRWVRRISDVIANLGVDTLFSLVNPDLLDRAYSHPRLAKVRKVSTLAGFVSEKLATRSVPRITERRVDIAYRGRRLPYWMGTLSQDKIRIATGVLAKASEYGLAVDISVEESARLYGKSWLDFLSSAKAVLGTEGGASIWDSDGKAEAAARQYLESRPHASFEEVHDAVLVGYEGDLLYNTMSPRLFEAIALRTALVMFPGWYDGIVEADRHYIPLEKDFSNFPDVVQKLSDDQYLQALVDRTFEDVVQSRRYSGESFLSEVDRVLEETVHACAERNGCPETIHLGPPGSYTLRLMILRAIGALSIRRLARQVRGFVKIVNHHRSFDLPKMIRGVIGDLYPRLSLVRFGVNAVRAVRTPREALRRLRSRRGAKARLLLAWVDRGEAPAGTADRREGS